MSESLIQWISALTGLSSLGVSVWAVLLVNKTLQANQAAVRAAEAAAQVTREIGEAQTRAYLFCKSASFDWDTDSVSARLEIANVGQSPAVDVKITGYVTLYDIGGPPEHPRVLVWLKSEETTSACEPVTVSGSVSDTIDFFWPNSFKIPEYSSEKGLAHTFRGGNEISFDARVEWSDVFGKQNSFTVDLRATVDVSPLEPKRRKRDKTGLLVQRMGDLTFHKSQTT